MPKQINYPIKLQFIINKENNKFTIQHAKLKFSCNLSEYPELPAQTLVNRMTLDQGEQQAVLSLCKNIFKKHLLEVEV